MDVSIPTLSGLSVYPHPILDKRLGSSRRLLQCPTLLLTSGNLCPNSTEVDQG